MLGIDRVRSARAGAAIVMVALGCAALGTAPAGAAAAKSYPVTATFTTDYPVQRIAVDPYTRTAYLALSDGNVQVVDEDTDRTVRIVDIGKSASDLALDARAHTLYITDPEDGTLAVLDTRSFSLYSVYVSSHVTRVALDTNLHTAFVSDGVDDMVSVVAGYSVTHTIVVPDAAGGIAVDAGTGFVFVRTGQNTVSVIKEATNTLTRTVTVPPEGDDLAVDPNTHDVYVTSFDDAAITVIDGSSFTITATIAVVGYPSAVAVDPRARTVYVLSSGGLVSVIDVFTNTVTATATVGTVSTTLAVDEGSHAVYSSAYNTVDVIEPVDGPCSNAPTVVSTRSNDRTSGPESLEVDGVSNGAGRLLLAFVEADGPQGVTQQVTRVRGGGLTWRLAARANGNYGTAEVWQARAAVGALFYDSVRAVLAQPRTHQGAMTVVAVSGAARRIGATASASATAVTHKVSTTIQAHACGSLIFAAGQDWSQNRNLSAAPHQSFSNVFSDRSVRNTFWTQRRNQPVLRPGPTNITTDGVRPGDLWSMAVVEVPGG